jgi:type IV pilus assembly protein PilA
VTIFVEGPSNPGHPRKKYSQPEERNACSLVGTVDAYFYDAPMNRPIPLSLKRARGRATRGFTLTELLLGLAIVSVLATLATVGYRRYFDSARISEPLATLQAIRTSQESIRRETGRYLNVSETNSYYPIISGFGQKKASWDATGHPDYARWKLLDVAADGPMRYGYKANAGRAGQMVAINIDYKAMPALPTPPSDEWFILQAQGDTDENGRPTVLVTTSFAPEVFIEEDQQ